MYLMYGGHSIYCKVYLPMKCSGRFDKLEWNLIQQQQQQNRWKVTRWSQAI